MTVRIAGTNGAISANAIGIAPITAITIAAMAVTGIAMACRIA